MRVIVIGGGPAGMMAAITAAEFGSYFVREDGKVGKKIVDYWKGKM